MKLRPVVVEFRVDGRTDVMKLIVAHRNFADASKNDTRSLSSFFWVSINSFKTVETEYYFCIENILFAAPCSLLPGSAAPLASHRPFPRKYVVSWVGLLAHLEVLDNIRCSWIEPRTSQPVAQSVCWLSCQGFQNQRPPPPNTRIPFWALNIFAMTPHDPPYHPICTQENALPSGPNRCQVHGNKSCQLALFGYPDRFFRAFSSVARQMPRCNSQRRGTARTLRN